MDDYAGSAATTGSVTPNGVSVTGSIESSFDSDWFRITLVGGVAYQLRATRDSSGGISDPYLSLYSSSGTLLQTDDDGGGSLNSLMSFTAPASGDYFLGVRDYGSDIGAYTVSAAAIDDFAASAASSGVVIVNGTAPSGRIDFAQDSDWFAVSLTAGVSYQLTANSAVTAGLSDPLLTLYSSSGAFVASDDDGGVDLNSLLVYTPSASGTYYVGVSGYNQSTGAYTVGASTADDFGASASSAGVAVIGGSRAGRIDSAGDQDWFRATLTAGRTYTIALQGANAPALRDPYFRGIYDSSGNLINGTANDDFGSSLDSRVVFTPAVTGTYYLAAGGYGDTVGNYSVSVLQRSTADIPGSASSNVTLAPGATASSVINTAGDRDWFKVSLTGGTRYAVTESSDATSATPLGDPFFRGVYTGQGRLLAGTANDDYGSSLNSRVVFVAPVTGTYYLAAGGYGSGKGAYTLSFERVTNVFDSIGSAPATASSVAVGVTGVAGSIDVARDVDWFRVTLTSGQAYIINVRGSDSNFGSLGDPELIGVYDSAGRIIPGSGNADSSGSPDAQGVFRPLTSGVYYVAVGGEVDGTGTYRVTVERTTTGDIPHDATTSASIAVGGAAISSMEQPGDVDWIRVTLSEGVTYQVRLLGSPSGDGTLDDPLIRGIFDVNGQAIPNTGNDDFGGSLNSQVTFTAGSSGTYFIAAGAYGNETGTYKLVVAPAAAADSAAPVLDSTSPADGTSGIAVDSNLSVVFNEAVRAGAGDIQISGGSQTLSIPVTSTQVSFSGEVMTINPGADLLAGTQYTVTFGAGVVKDSAGNDFAGITQSTGFNFATAASTAPGGTWTVMVYIAGDNNLEGYALRDLNEMESVTLPGTVDVVTLFDRAQGYDSTHGNWTDTRFGQVLHDTSPTTVTSLAGFQTLGELNTGSGTTLTQFINRAAASNPADHYALVIWDHGAGIHGIASDDASGGDIIRLAELRSAIDASNVDHFDLIGFDACLQGMLEQSWDMRPFADVLVGSEALEPGDGWAYDAWLGALASAPGMTATDLARAIVTSYGAEYAGMDDITLSAIDTSQLLAIDSALDTFVANALALPGNSADWTQIREAASRTVFFPGDDSTWNFRDLGDFMDEVAGRVSSPTLRNDAIRVADAVDGAVFANSGTVAGATGLSIYLPFGSSPVDPTYTASNYSFLADSNWENFLAAV
jgi:hypothetical protein